MKGRDVESRIAGTKVDPFPRDRTIREIRELEKALTGVLSNALSQWKSRHRGQLELGEMLTRSYRWRWTNLLASTTTSAMLRQVDRWPFFGRLGRGVSLGITFRHPLSPKCEGLSGKTATVGREQRAHFATLSRFELKRQSHQTTIKRNLCRSHFQICPKCAPFCYIEISVNGIRRCY